MVDLLNQIPDANATNGAIATLLYIAGRLTAKSPVPGSEISWRDTARKLFISLSFGVMYRYFQRVHGLDLFAALAREWQCQRDDARARVLSRMWRTD